MELGKIYKTLLSKKGNEVVLRTPKWEDLEECLRLVNRISKEDTFVALSGEEIGREEEIEWLVGAIKMTEKGEALYLFAFIGQKLIGNCEFKKGQLRRRDKHVGNFGIMVDKEYREEGIGTEMLKALIREAKGYDLKVLRISVFANNLRAIHTYEKVGFIKCGEIPKGILYKGKHIGEIIMTQEVE